MNKRLSAAIVGIVVTALGALPAYAQDLKAMLLKPANGWVIEWSSPGGDRGVTEAVFADRGEKVVAKLKITDAGLYGAANTICERDVAITVDAISLNGCADQGIVLIRDPSDRAYPLKTKTRTVNGYDWKLKEK